MDQALPVAMTVLHGQSEDSSVNVLMRHLSAYQQVGKLAIWHRGNVGIGDSIAQQVAKHVSTAKLIVLMLSPELIADHYDYINLALKAKQEGAILVPVMCRPVLLRGLPLDGLAVLPRDLPVGQSTVTDEVWWTVARDIMSLVDGLRQGNDMTVGKLPVPPVERLQPPGRDVRPGKIVILFLTASPLDTSPLDVGRDVKQIGRCLQAFPSRDRFELVQEWAVERSELLSILLKHKPTIVHFSGHGSRTGQIVLEDGNGQARPVPTKALAQLFGTLNDDGGVPSESSIQCVVLSACYIEPQAQAIAEHVSCVVGIKGEIHDVTAASFSAGFYSALAAGESFAKAFDLGRSQIELVENQAAELRLIVKAGQDARQLRLLTKRAVEL